MAKKKVKRDAASRIGLKSTATARVGVKAPARDHLGLEQALEAQVEAFNDAATGLGLRQTLDALVITGPASYTPAAHQGWERIHEELFTARESAHGRNEELLSAILLCLHVVDADPPETALNAIQRLEAMLRGTKAQQRVLDVLGGLRGRSFRLRP